MREGAGGVLVTALWERGSEGLDILRVNGAARASGAFLSSASANLLQYMLLLENSSWEVV